MTVTGKNEKKKKYPTALEEGKAKLVGILLKMGFKQVLSIHIMYCAKTALWKTPKNLKKK